MKEEFQPLWLCVAGSGVSRGGSRMYHGHLRSRGVRQTEAYPGAAHVPQYERNLVSHRPHQTGKLTITVLF